MNMEASYSGQTHEFTSNSLDDLTVAPKRTKEEQAKENLERLQCQRFLDLRIARARYKVIHDLVQVTPALARELLERNPDNRKLNKARIEGFARDIQGGKWSLNGESMIISKDGLLNDGQNRCAAIILADKPIDTLMVFGVDRESRMTVDTGGDRTVANHAAMRRIENPAAVAQLSRFIFMYQQRGRLSVSGADYPTRVESQLVIDSCPSIQEHVQAAKGGGKVSPPAVLSFCHWLLCSVSKRHHVNEFFDMLISGHSLSKKSPILFARNRLAEIKGNRDPNLRVEIILRAWNYHRKGVVSNFKTDGTFPTLEK